MYRLMSHNRKDPIDLSNVILLAGIILAGILRAPMAHHKILRVPFLKSVRHVMIVITGQKLLQKTLVLDFWCHFVQLKISDN